MTTRDLKRFVVTSVLVNVVSAFLILFLVSISSNFGFANRSDEPTFLTSKEKKVLDIT